MAKKSFIIKARNFINFHRLKGPNGFLKFVILNYVEAINKVSKDFVFKGGNLVWYYLKTPRATIDLDFSTINLKSNEEVKKILINASSLAEGITYSIEKFTEILIKRNVGASVVVKYTTEDGASNQFEIDIVYALDTEFSEVCLNLNDDSTIVQVASIESVIIDKISASHRFKSGNTQMKDYDDLYRFASCDLVFNKEKILNYLKINKISKILDEKWISEPMQRAWKLYSKKYSDLPSSLNEIFKVVNNKF